MIFRSLAAAQSVSYPGGYEVPMRMDRSIDLSAALEKEEMKML